MKPWGIIENGSLFQVRDSDGRLHASFPSMAECRAYISGVAEGLAAAGALIREGQEQLQVVAHRVQELVPRWSA